MTGRRERAAFLARLASHLCNGPAERYRKSMLNRWWVERLSSPQLQVFQLGEIFEKTASLHLEYQVFLKVSEGGSRSYWKYNGIIIICKDKKYKRTGEYWWDWREESKREGWAKVMHSVTVRTTWANFQTFSATMTTKEIHFWHTYLTR